MPGIRSLYAAFVTGLLLVAVAGPAFCKDLDWASTWQASPEPARAPIITLNNQTVRQVLRISLAGAGSSIQFGSDRTLNFGGNPEVVMRLPLECRLSRRRLVVTDPLPDRLCVDPTSRYYDEKLLARNIGIRFNGVERTNVEEYCVSEGWIRSAVGKTLDRRGKPLTVLLKGKVEPFFKD